MLEQNTPEQNIQFADLPDTVFYKIASYLKENDVNTLIQTGPISEHFSNFIALKKEDELFNKIVNNPIFELDLLNGTNTLPISAFFYQLKELNRQIHQLLEEGHSREQLVRQLRLRDLNLTSESINGLALIQEEYLQEADRRRRKYEHLMNCDITVNNITLVAPNIFSILAATFIAIPSFSWTVLIVTPFFFAGAVALVITCTMLGSALASLPIFIAHALGHTIAENQLLAEFDKKHEKNLAILDNLKGLMELVSEDCDNNEAVQKSEELRNLFLESPLFQNTNSTGIQKIQRELEKYPFMSTDTFFDLIQRTFEARNNLCALQGFFCKINRASGIQSLYNLVRNPEFDLRNNPESRIELIETIGALQEAQQMEGLENRNAEIPTETTPLLFSR